MKYVYPAVIQHEDNVCQVTIPDLPGAFTYGDTLAEAIEMAEDAAAMWLWDAERKGESIPAASEQNTIEHGENDQVTIIVADTDEYRRRNDTQAVKKTLSIPAWLNYEAEKNNAPYSQLLQQALKGYLGISD